MSTEPLPIPDEVIVAWCQGADVDWEAASHDVALISAPVVAAELRRLAPLLADRGSSADLLRARADELDPDAEEQR